MPVNLENIKKALDCFERDNYVEAKEILKKEINKAKSEYISDKIGVDVDDEVDDDEFDDEVDDDQLSSFEKTELTKDQID